MDHSTESGTVARVGTVQKAHDFPVPTSSASCVMKMNGIDEDGVPFDCTFYLVGTAHVSAQSCNDVAQVIRIVQPDVIFLEICHERQSMLHMKASSLLKESSPPSLFDVLKDIRRGTTNGFQGIYGWLLAKVGHGLEVLPGEEFRVAVREAREVDARLVLGDRPLHITLARVWGALGWWKKLKLVGMLLWTGVYAGDSATIRSEVEAMKENDVLTQAIQEFGKEFPELVDPLIRERDQYMTEVLRQLPRRGATRVVAVVGAGHVQGIQNNWDTTIDMDEICKIPSEKKAQSFVGWLLGSRNTIVASATLCGGLYLCVKYYNRNRQ